MKRLLILVLGIFILSGCQEETETETQKYNQPDAEKVTEGKLIYGDKRSPSDKVYVAEICENGWVVYLYHMNGYESGGIVVRPKIDSEGNWVRCTNPDHKH